MASKSWHDHSWPGTGPGVIFLDFGTSFHNHLWWRHLAKEVCGLLFMQTWDCKHFKISFLNQFFTTFLIWIFHVHLASSCVYGMFLVKAVLLFQKTDEELDGFYWEISTFLSTWLCNLNFLLHFCSTVYKRAKAIYKEKSRFFAFVASLDLGSM